MRWTRYVALVLTLLGVMQVGAWAQDQEKTEDRWSVVSKAWYVLYEVGADGRVTQTIEARNKIVRANALETMKVFGFSFSASIQSGEIVQAYTLKEDGRKLVVAPSNFQNTRNSGQDKAAPVFSDRSSVSVVFPDLAVGDTVGIVYKITDKEPIFPGHFSVVQTLSPYAFYDDVRLSLRVPKDMRLHIETHQLAEMPALVEKDTRTLQWRYQNRKPLAWSESDEGLWRVEDSPSLIVSTFENYEAIAQAYGDRALPKAEPTQRIRALVATILGQETQELRRAQLLYEWVSKNITYAGNNIGVGAVVPRELDMVLDNKMGDCKDHASLLQAMLAAADIRSEQVLINATGLYDLNKTPAVSLINHVINYLPQQKLYVDSTAKDIPFGYLPSGAYGKPVIHVGVSNALARTPDQQHEKAEQRLRMKMRIAKDGSASGELEVSLRGLQAASARAYMRDLSQDAQKDFVKRALSSYGFRGHGVLKKGDTTGMTDRYAFSLSFDISNFLSGGATGAFVLAPVVATPMSVMNFADIKKRMESTRRQVCYGFHSYETYDIQLDPGLTFVSLPAATKIRSALFDFTAQYRRTKTGISVARELHDKTPSSVCSAQTMNELYKQAQPAAQNLRTQILYRR